jgi:signal transduction histidine kinase
VLEIFSREPSVFGPEQLAFFKALGQEVGVALENARLFQQVRGGRQRLQHMSRQLVQVQEAERRQIARELHDEIGQILTGLKLTLEMSKRRPSDTLRVSLEEALTLANDLIGRVRELSLDLRPAMLDDLGLLPALLWLIERYSNRTGVRVILEHTGIEKRLRPDLETAAYRIVQEALTNVARHAGVPQAKARIWKTPDALILQVEDHGRGFDPAALFASVGTGGLSGMRERAHLLGGQFTVESSPGSGARLTAELPLSESIRRQKRRR